MLASQHPGNGKSGIMESAATEAKMKERFYNETLLGLRNDLEMV